MNSLSKWVGAGFVPVVCAVFLSTIVIAAERAVYDKPDIEVPGTTIYGKVIKVAERDAVKHAWDVSIENAAMGEVVQVRLDKRTERKEKDSDPAPGDRVVVKYDDHSKHALIVVKDVPHKTVALAI